MIFTAMASQNKRKVSQDQSKKLDNSYIKLMIKTHTENDNRFLEMVGDQATSFNRNQAKPQNHKELEKVSFWMIDPNSRYKLIFDMISLSFIAYDIIDVKL